MTEEEARRWLQARFGSAAVLRLATFVDLLIAETARQNLVAGSTVETVWLRHVVDSAQLIELAPQMGLWLDVGTGGGFPGLVVALLRDQAMVLVEPRRRRAEFLKFCVAELQLHATVEVQAKSVEQVTVSASVISARAVASVEKLLHAAAGCATLETRWVLPRGRSASSELADLERRWMGVFHVEQSLTDSGAGILLMDRVERR